MSEPKSAPVQFPVAIFKAVEHMLRGMNYDQQHEVDKAKRHYRATSKILLDVINRVSDVPYEKLWLTQAQICNNRVKQLMFGDRNKSAQAMSRRPSSNNLATKAESKHQRGPQSQDEDKELEERIDACLLSPRAKLTWDDLIGLDKIVELVKEVVVLPLKHPKVLQKRPGALRTVLTFGPPGCGKTLLVMILTAQVNINVYAVSAASLLSKWFGESQKMIKKLYTTAWKNAPSIVFIDEFDGMFGTTGGNSEMSSTVVQIQKELLQYMDGAYTPEINQTVTIAATNNPWALDSAQVRRFERVLYVPPPNLEAIQHLLAWGFLEVPNSLRSHDRYQLGLLLRGYTPSEIINICKTAKVRAFKAGIQNNKMQSVSREDVLASLETLQPMLKQRGKAGVGTIEFRKWNRKWGRPPIEYPVEPWEEPAYHPSQDPDLQKENLVKYSKW